MAREFGPGMHTLVGSRALELGGKMCKRHVGLRPARGELGAAVRGDPVRTDDRPHPDMPGLYTGSSGSPVVEPQRFDLGQEGSADGRGKRTGFPGHVALGQPGPLPELRFPLQVVGLDSGVPRSLPALSYLTQCETRQKQKHSLTEAVFVHVGKAGPREPEGWGSGCALGVPLGQDRGLETPGSSGQLMGCNSPS